MRMTGYFDGTFEQALEKYPFLITNSLYYRNLQPFVERFGTEHLFIGRFSDLSSDPESFAQSIFEFLNVTPKLLPAELHGKVLPASRARATWLAKAARHSADTMRLLGLANLLGRIKSSSLVRRALYKPYDPREKPSANPETMAQLRQRFAEDVRNLDHELVTGIAERWGYGDADEGEGVANQTPNTIVREPAESSGG
jgi:hypothetical protein